MFESTYAGYGGVPKNDEKTAFVDRVKNSGPDGLQNGPDGTFNNLTEKAEAMWSKGMRLKDLPY